MLATNQLLSVFKKLFTDQTYGQSLQNYISSRNPQTPADVEFFEKQWQYGNTKTTGGHWL